MHCIWSILMSTDSCKTATFFVSSQANTYMGSFIRYLGRSVDQVKQCRIGLFEIFFSIFKVDVEG